MLSNISAIMNENLVRKTMCRSRVEGDEITMIFPADILSIQTTIYTSVSGLVKKERYVVEQLKDCSDLV